MRVRSCLYCDQKELSPITTRSDGVNILKCTNCGLMMVESTSKQTEHLYTAEYFEKQEDNKSGYTNYLSAPVANLMGKYAFVRLFDTKIKSHLDLGCADGSLIEIFKSQGISSSGLEISREAVGIAQSKGLNVSYSNLIKFPKTKEGFTSITAFDVLEHLEYLRPTLEQIHKNLVSDGYFIFSTLSVKREDSSDYWFNNSLEHYIYFNRQNLENVLNQTFGAGNHTFIEVENNGVAEFWGIAKKGKLTTENKLMQSLEHGLSVDANPEVAYLASLFYNQVSRFSDSNNIINSYKDKWTSGQLYLAKFYNNYFQGKFEAIVNDSKDSNYFVGTDNAPYWQALCHVEQGLFSIKEEEFEKVHQETVMDLSSELFKTREEIKSLHKSKIVGRAIRLRENIGALRNNANRVKKEIIKLPLRVVSSIRRIGAPFVPGRLRKRIKRLVRKNRSVQITLVRNKLWRESDVLVSIVVPYYNRHTTIDDTLHSLSLQTYKCFEIIVVDDGSDDTKSLEKLNEIIKTQPKIRIIHQTNEGVASARNKGINNSAGKYIICLDSDDILDPTYIEKAVLVLESDPETDVVTTNMQVFGVAENKEYKYQNYDPLRLIHNNMVTTAAVFKKEAWEETGGYKSNIGYEDWEFWINLSEHGYWGKHIPEPLFRYRTSLESRYIEDKDKHHKNRKMIQSLHPSYSQNVKKLLDESGVFHAVASSDTAFINLRKKSDYMKIANKRNILITIPWMTFGGAETLILNYTREIKNQFNLFFITALKAEHEWEYKFKEISPNIYHLSNLFDNHDLYLEFISNLIRTREIDVLHIIHNGYVFEMLSELKRRHPKLKVVVTMFNDHVEYFKQSIDHKEFVDSFTTDNLKVADSYKGLLSSGSSVTVIPNGINVEDDFNPAKFDRNRERNSLRISDDEIAVFFVGRLSQEKNPETLLEVAKLTKENDDKKIRFFIIGDGPQKSMIERRIKKHKLRNVQFLGYKKDVARYLCAADVFILPSSVEGFPLSILEAMAMETAVIASKVGAVPDVVEEGRTGFIVPPGSAEHIAKVLLMLDEQPKLLQSVKLNARKEIEEKYSNGLLGKRYKELYNKVLE